MRLPLIYLIKRIAMFFVVVWATASFNFLLPRLAPGDPIAGIVGRMSQQGANTEGSSELIAHYRAVFGLDESVWVQYVLYLKALLTLDFGYSLAFFPANVLDIIARSLPWTIGLLLSATVISFIIGTLMGAWLVWRPSERAVQVFAAPVMLLSAIPYYLLGIFILYIFAFELRLLPAGGSGEIGLGEQSRWAYWLDVIEHSILPALSIVLASIGGWMLSMRGLMVSVMGEDYLTLARAKGLPERVIFLRYAVRNAMVPQVTILAMALGNVVSGAALVEIVYSYPGVGYQLYRSIGNADYTTIQGITFILVVSVAFAVLLLDLLYPRLDPRISYQRR